MRMYKDLNHVKNQEGKILDLLEQQKKVKQDYSQKRMARVRMKTMGILNRGNGYREMEAHLEMQEVGKTGPIKKIMRLMQCLKWSNKTEKLQICLRILHAQQGQSVKIVFSIQWLELVDDYTFYIPSFRQLLKRSHL